LYGSLPFPVDYAPYTARHVTATLGLLGFTALGFFALLKHLDPKPTVSLDTDWFYRRGPAAAFALAGGALLRLESFVSRIADFVIERPVLGAAALLRELDARVIDATAVGIGRLTHALSQGLRLAVSGHAQHYGLLMAAGVLAAIAMAVLTR
jgi:multicomponent Na+:H+ antiporter subunit D